MKEFKFYSNGFELPVSVCETQKEAVYEITSAREALKLLDKEGECGCEKLIIDVIYKDGSTYYNSNNYEEEGKFKRTGIARAMVSTEYGTVVFGDFAITEYGDVTIEESDIEEYGVYAGQYDVKEEVFETETNETTAETTAEQEIVEGISKMETTTEADDSGFEYYSVETAYEVDFRDRQNKVFKTYSEAKEKVIENFESETFNIAKAEEKKTQFDFYNVTIGFEVEKFIGTIPADYESLGIYSDYEKAVQAAQAAADEYGAENIYFHTVEIATRNDREVYDRDDYEDFIEERETIRHNWYTLMIMDTGKREHVNLDKPVRLDFKE